MICTKNHYGQAEMCKISCEHCLKRRYSLLSELSNDELAVLNSGRYVVNYAQGEIIFKEGNKPQGLICLNSGKVKIVITGMNGSEQIIGLMKPVDFLGFNELVGDLNYQCTGIALEEVSVCIIDKGDFFKIIRGNPSLSLKIMKRLANDLKNAHDRTLNLTQKHIRARMADALLRILEVYGINPESKCLNVSFKRSELAALSNMTTANAIRVLSSFSKEDLISIDGRNIILKNPKKLNQISIVGT